MKMILGIISIVIVGYLAWRWFAPTTVAPTPAQRIAPKPAAAHPPPPKRLAQQPAAKPTPAPAVAAQRRLAPEGTYFLLERASLRIDSGVIGFAPGTKVTLLDQGDSATTVTDGQYQLTVPSSQLTNDLDIAASVAKSDYAAQAQLAELTARWAQEYNQQQRDAFIASEKEKEQKKTRPRATPRASKR
jgi:type IV secretory pathway VirB10-like protein